jgi:hypothetical protein
MKLQRNEEVCGYKTILLVDLQLLPVVRLQSLAGTDMHPNFNRADMITINGTGIARRFGRAGVRQGKHGYRLASAPQRAPQTTLESKESKSMKQEYAEIISEAVGTANLIFVPTEYIVNQMAKLNERVSCRSHELEVGVEPRVVMIWAEQRKPEGTKTRQSGYTAIHLSSEVDPTNLSAALKDGILLLTLTKTSSKKGRSERENPVGT